MSTAATRLGLAAARLVADRIAAALRPACLRLEVAGSVRRQRPQIGDLELVAVPHIVIRPGLDLFRTPGPVDLLEERVAELLRAGTLAPHPERPANGARYKRLWIADPGMQLDLFVVRPPAEWGPILAIRTGPSEYSQSLVTRLRHNGLRCEGGAVYEGAERIPCPEEHDFFRLARVPFTPPECRR